MKANELRIGNYVSYGGEIVRVTGVDQEYVYIDRITFDYLQHGDVEPVELTDEILKKVGVKSLKFIGINVEYLHDLQNLYFALTGEELTIKI